jgi:dTDP-4-amino-4,6-dideoxygalactose transaminase
MKIPFVDLYKQYTSIKDQIDTAIENVISETAFIGGKYVEKFEKDFENIYGVNNCISCANGTDSLYIIMKMMDIGVGDEVITVANSWISTSETIGQTGAIPVFVDCDPVYYTIDIEKIESKITKKTKAIIPVHLYGQMCDMDGIIKIAKKYNLKVIEDCAQSHFSTYNNINAGLIGDAGSFSFYPGKNLGAYGDAGCIITNNNEYAQKYKMFARHGALKKHEHLIEGINSRMDGLQAAILSVKLKYINQWTRNRQKNAEKLTKALEGVGDIVTPEIRPNSTHSFHLFVIQTNHRDSLKSYLQQNNIETAIHYPRPLPFLEAYKKLNYRDFDFPIANSMSKKILSLPMYAEINDSSIEYITEKIKNFYENK